MYQTLTYYLAIDQGTHASRACLFDEAGRLVSEHSKNIKLDRLSKTNIEQDASEIVDSVKEVVTKILQQVNPQDAIAACGITIQRSSVIAWLHDGTAISPVLSWQDTRGAQQLQSLRNVESEIQALSGLPLSAHYGASKLHYLLNKASSQNISIDSLRLSPLISYLLFHLLEEHPYIIDHTNAQRTQLFGISEMNWSSRLTELFNVPLQTLPACVPVINNSNTAHGKLADTEIPVTAISGDQNAAIFGAGLLSAETALVNFGSGAFVLCMLKGYRASKKQLSSIAYSDNKTVQYAREATINGAGSSLAWLEKQYGVTDIWKQLPQWLDETGMNEMHQPPVFINTIGGLGSPWWNNEIEPEFIDTACGETDQSFNATGSGSAVPATVKLPAQSVAVIESIVFMVCCNLEIIQSEQSIKRLRICGGLSQLDGLCQRLANLSGLTVERMNLPEATARGIAWLAAGKPQSWLNIDLELFEPVNSPDLKQRYLRFNATLKSRLQKNI